MLHTVPLLHTACEALPRKAMSGPSRTAFNRAATLQLHKAAAEGDLQGVTAALAGGANPAALNPDDDNPPLIAAASAGHTQIVMHLLGHGAKAHQARPSDGKHALHTAAEEGHCEVVTALLQHPTPAPSTTPLVLVPDMDGWLPLHWAAYYGDCRVAGLLLAGGADLAAQQIKHENFMGQTPLAVCLQMCGSNWRNESGRCCDFPALLSLLHKHGADVSGWTSPTSGGTALHEVVKEGGEPGCVTTLVTLGTHVDATTCAQAGGVTALHLAVASGSLPLTSALLDAGAALDVVERDRGMTPLLLAAQAGNTSLVDLLLEHKASACARDDQGLGVPTLLLLGHGEEDPVLPHLARVLDQLALQTQASDLKSIQSESGRAQVPTALHVAALKRWARATAVLLQAPDHVTDITGSVHHTDHQGDTPLHAALRGLTSSSCVQVVADIVHLLCAAGANPHALNASNQKPGQVATWYPAASAEVDAAQTIKSGVVDDQEQAVEELLALLRL